MVLLVNITWLFHILKSECMHDTDSRNIWLALLGAFITFPWLATAQFSSQL